MGVCFSSYGNEKLGGKSMPSMRNPGVEINQQLNKIVREESLDVKSLKSITSVKSVTDLLLSPKHSNAYTFTYEEMAMATKQFKADQIIGEGGFGVVYKGVIDGSKRSECKTTNVAIKELNPDSVQGDREWLAEVNYLGQLSHPNLVKLVGYCCEDEHRLLVYEHMARGSLEKHLFRREGSTLSWGQRMKIALDAAKGLAFLHCAERSIIYRDFKTSNILLDKDFNAKLSDFGLAKDGPMGDQTHVSTRVMGTHGYAAPEYVMTGHLTSRSDVYGFGVVLLELLLGRKALDKNRPSKEHNLVEWARPILIQSKKVLKIVDPMLKNQYSSRKAAKVGALAQQCLSHNPKGRPLMSEVVEVLERVQSSEDDSYHNKGPEGLTNEDKTKSFNDPERQRHSSKELRSRSEPAMEVME